MAITEHTYSAHCIDDRGRSIGLLAIVEPGLLTHQRPQLVQVDGRAVGCIPLQMVMSHTHLTKVTWMAENQKSGQCQQVCMFLYLANPLRVNVHLPVACTVHHTCVYTLILSLLVNISE